MKKQGILYFSAIVISSVLLFSVVGYSNAQTPVQQNTTEATLTPSPTTIIIPSGSSIPNQVEEPYQPESMQVKAGSIVTWLNRDNALHTATAGNPVNGPSGQFDTGLIRPGAFGSAKIEGEGQIPYYCTLHPFMLGTIQVVSDNAAATTASQQQPTQNATAIDQPPSAGNMTSNATQTAAEGATMIAPLTATGSIASQILPVAQSPTNNTNIASDSQNRTYVLSGIWDLNVENSNSSQFEARFDMVGTDGAGRHTHDISNFAPIQMSQQNGTTIITGTADISTNGTSSNWNDVFVTLIVQNNSTLAIGVNAESTDNHFRGQPILGIIESMKDAEGNELVQSSDGPIATLQEGLSDLRTNATQAGRAIMNQTGQAGETLLNESADVFANITR